jgi:hypothetical protein
MAKSSKEPLRGEAAWRAAKQEVSARNEAAYARGRDDRAKRNADAIRRRIEQDRQMTHDMPSGHS